MLCPFFSGCNGCLCRRGNRRNATRSHIFICAYANYSSSSTHQTGFDAHGPSTSCFCTCPRSHAPRRGRITGRSFRFKETESHAWFDPYYLPIYRIQRFVETYPCCFCLVFITTHFVACVLSPTTRAQPFHYCQSENPPFTHPFYRHPYPTTFIHLQPFPPTSARCRCTLCFKYQPKRTSRVETSVGGF